MRYIVILALFLGNVLPAYAKGGGMQFWGNVAQNYSADQIQVGMSEWQVMNLGLRPDSSNTVTTAQGTVDTWCFNNLGRCVFFLNGSVAAVQDNSSGGAATLGAILNQSINNASQSNQPQSNPTQSELTQQSQDKWTQQYEKLDAELKAGLITRDQLEAGYKAITDQRLSKVTGTVNQPKNLNKTSSDTLTVSGITDDGEGSSALINGNSYKVGDVVNGYEIVNIGNDYVEFMDKNGLVIRKSLS